MDFATEHEFEDEVFDNIKWIDQDLKSKRFVACAFSRCDFTGSRFGDSRFDTCRFDHCNLSLIRLDGARLQRVTFNKCKIDGVDFSGCNPFMLKIDFDQCLIQRSNFSQMQLDQTRFSKCEVMACDFVGADLTGSEFSGSSLQDSLFEDTNLSGVDLCRASDYAVNPLLNKMKGTRVSFPEALSMLHYLGIIVTDAGPDPDQAPAGPGL